MTADKALEILSMSEQARCSECAVFYKTGYESKDVEEAVETIREALKPCKDIADALTEIISYVDNGSQRDLDRVDELAKQIMAKVAQQPCTDAISRRKAIHAISACDGKSAQIEALEQLPPATPQQKTGRWIFKAFDEETGISNSYWCSACNYPMAQVYDDCCAHCGAKMERERRKKNADNT